MTEWNYLWNSADDTTISGLGLGSIGCDDFQPEVEMSIGGSMHQMLTADDVAAVGSSSPAGQQETSPVADIADVAGTYACRVASLRLVFEQI